MRHSPVVDRDRRPRGVDGVSFCVGYGAKMDIKILDADDPL